MLPKNGFKCMSVAIDGMKLKVQPNFNGSNTLGIMKLCFRQGQLELMRFNNSTRSSGIIGLFFSIFFDMKVCNVFTLESHHQSDSNEYKH